MSVLWVQHGKKVTEGNESELLAIFNSITWQLTPVKMSPTRGANFRSIIRSYKKIITHVGEVSSPYGNILAVRTYYDKGRADIFFREGVSVITPLAVKKYWEDN